MKSTHLLNSLPLIFGVISGVISTLEVLSFDVNAYLTGRPETWLLMFFVVLYVYLVTKRSLRHVSDQWTVIIGVLAGGGAHLIASAGGAVLWLLVDRLSNRILFGGITLAFSNIAGEYSALLLSLVLVLLGSLFFLACIPVLQLGALVATALVVCSIVGLFEVNRLPEQLSDRVLFVSRRLRDVRVGLPEFTKQEELMLNKHWTEKGFKVFSEMQSVAASPSQIQAFYWCLQDRIDCRLVEQASATDSTEFPRSLLVVGVCQDLGGLSEAHLPPHRGVKSLSLGGKSRPCQALSTWPEIENLFPDVRELELNEPTEDLLTGLPDHITSLSVRMKEVSTGILEAIGSHRQIETLKLSTTFLPESALFYLSGMENLQRLWLKGRGLSNDRLRGGELPALREITLGPGSPIALFDIRNLESLRLKRLEIFSDTLTTENVQKVVAQFPAPPNEVIVKQYEFPLANNPNLPNELKEVLLRQMAQESQW